MKSRIIVPNKVGFFLSLCCLSLIILSYAARVQAFSSTNDSTDKNSQSTFSAKTAECKQEASGANVCYYRHDANFQDKKSRLWAPVINVYRDEGDQIVKIVAIGNGSKQQAHYQGIVNSTDAENHAANNETAKKNEPAKPTNADANTITIYPPKNLMILVGKAKMAKDGDTIAGSYLEYDIAQQTILAKPQKKELTTIVLRSRKN